MRMMFAVLIGPGSSLPGVLYVHPDLVRCFFMFCQGPSICTFTSLFCFRCLFFIFFKEAIVFFKRDLTRDSSELRMALQSRNTTKHKVQKGSTRINKDQKGSLRCVQIMRDSWISINSLLCGMFLAPFKAACLSSHFSICSIHIIWKFDFHKFSCFLSRAPLATNQDYEPKIRLHWKCQRPSVVV